MEKRKLVKNNCFKAVLFLLCTSILTAIIADTGILHASSVKVKDEYKNDSKIKSYEDQIEQVARDMEALDAKMKNAEAEIGSTMAEKIRLDEEIELLEQQIALTEGYISALEEDILNKENEVENCESEYEKKYEQFKLRLRAAHEGGNVSYLEMLLGAKSLSEFLASVDRVGSMIEYDSKIMRELTENKTDLETAKADYSDQKAKMISSLVKLESDKKTLERKRVEAANYISKLENDEANYKALYEQNLAREAELEKQLTARMKELEEMSKRFIGKDNYLWPLPTTYKRVSSSFGYRTSPITGKPEYHNGIDIPAPLGTDIYAANDGTVTIATTHYSYGKYIMIDHGGGYFTLYAHCSSINVKVGQKVNQGDVIGKVGSTGYSTGNHLHFSMYEKSTPANPNKWFKW